MLALAACSGGGDVASEEWVPVTVGEFTLEMPEEPEHETLEAPTAAGPIAIDSYIVEQGSNAVAFAVNDLPAEATAGGPDPVLAGAVAGAASNIGGEVVTEEEVDVGGYPGRDAEISATSQGTEVVVFLRALLVDDQLVQLQSLGPAEDREQIQATFDRLVASFAVGG